MSFYESLNVSLSCLTLFWRRFGVVWLCFDVVVAFHRDSKVWVELLVGEMIQWYVNNDGTWRIKNFLNFFLFSKNFLSCPSLLPSSPPPRTMNSKRKLTIKFIRAWFMPPLHRDSSVWTTVHQSLWVCDSKAASNDSMKQEAAKRWLFHLTNNQCDQMAKLCFKICALTPMKICPLAWKIA